MALWTVGGAAAWYSVKQKVQFTISEAPVGDSHRVDKVALVEEAVGGLRGDVQALAKALETNLGALAEQLADGDAKRLAKLELTLAKLAQRLAEREADLSELNRSFGEHRAVLDTVLARVEARSGAHPTGLPEVAKATTEETRTREPAKAPPAETEKARPAQAEKSEPTKQPAAVETPVVEKTPAKPPARKFLSFQLPSTRFSFDKPQSFEIIASLSRVGFDAKSTLHDFSGVTSKISGGFETNLAAPNGATKGRISVEASTLDTGLESRNTAMHDEHLHVKKFPALVFELVDVRTPKADGKAMTVTGTAVGKMTIHGVTRAVEMPIRAKIDASRRLFVEGETKLKISDYEIPIPSKLGLISMQDEVGIWISLRARPGVER